MRHNTLVLSSILGTFLIASSCGAKKENSPEDSPSQEDFTGDATLLQGTVSSMADAAIEATSTNEVASASLLGLVDLSVTRTRSCESENDTATVEIESSVSGGGEITTGFGSMTRTITGSSEQTRVWSRVGGSVSCASDNKHADIDWTNVDGLRLTATFERSRAMQMTQTFANGRTMSKSRSFSASGTRSVTWTASTETGDEFTRSMTVTTDSTREIKIANKNGKTNEMRWTVKTSDDAPLSVDVTRQSSDKAITSKVINSGTLVATTSRGSAQTTFNAFTMTYSGTSLLRTCAATSGSYTVNLYRTGESTPVKTYTVTITASGATMNDGTSDTPIDVPACDPEDATE